MPYTLVVPPDFLAVLCRIRAKTGKSIRRQILESMVDHFKKSSDILPRGGMVVTINKKNKAQIEGKKILPSSHITGGGVCEDKNTSKEVQANGNSN